MDDRKLKIAIIHEIFPGEEAEAALVQALRKATDAGATLALLPELPLDPWVPATRDVRDEDAEGPDGPRQLRFQRATREAGIGLLGGAIVRDPDSGRRFNRAWLFDADGGIVTSYDKLHVPCEPGFWEADHYDEGDRLPQRIDAFGVPMGIQICSDMQRPQIATYLGALGVEAIVAPRATPPASFERWRTVLRAAALSACAYVISINRPRPERDVTIGGPSIVVAPDGSVVTETSDPLQLVTLDRHLVDEARREYPGYLNVRPELYVRAWKGVGSSR